MRVHTHTHVARTHTYIHTRARAHTHTHTGILKMYEIRLKEQNPGSKSITYDYYSLCQYVDDMVCVCVCARARARVRLCV